jgi:ubiquitin-protein ligase
VANLKVEARLQRIAIEATKLAEAHPDVANEGNTFYCYIHPRRGPARRITVQTNVDYPFVAPKAFVHPFDDIRGMPHILAEGEVCYIGHFIDYSDMPQGWNPNLHTLAFVFTQVKRIVHEAVMARYGR